MSNNTANSTVEPVTVETPAVTAPTHWEITLNRAVSLNEWLYKPGFFHVVDQVTLDKMGDAVASKVPYTQI